MKLKKSLIIISSLILATSAFGAKQWEYYVGGG